MLTNKWPFESAVIHTTTTCEKVCGSNLQKMKPDCDTPPDTRLALVQRYLHLTRTVMPALAQTQTNEWLVQNDHCFQRIVLDAVCGRVWYVHVLRPAYSLLVSRASAPRRHDNG